MKFNNNLYIKYFADYSTIRNTFQQLRIPAIALILLFTFSVNRTYSQLSLSTGLSSWIYLGGSNDQSFHPGLNLRLAYDYHQFVIDGGFSYYLPVHNSVTGKAIQITNPPNPLAPKLTIYNNVQGNSWQSYLNFQYYFTGLPTKGYGFYGLIGPGVLYYTQEYDISDFDDTKYTPIGFYDGFRKSISQYTINIGFGGSIPIRKSNFFFETRMSFPTNKDIDIDYAIVSSHFLSIEGGFRFPILSRKNKWERMSLGRKSGIIRKTKARIRQ